MNSRGLTGAERRRLLEQLLLARAESDAATHPYAAYVNPHLGRVLRGLALDKRYLRGEGCWLFDEDGNRYLDFTAAYGALPFGYNPPDIWDAIREVELRREPSLVQPSYAEAAGELAAELVAVAPRGLRRVTFANSGAEAIEAALKLARAAAGRLGVVSTWNAFHGKTLGALSATGRARYQQPFGAPTDGFTHVPFGDANALEAELERRAGEVAAFVVEPIQAEGGIVVPPLGYLRAVKEVCAQHDVLVILDEVQTGLGRTGRLFACEEDDVAPDILTVAKALGGGLVPVAAAICTEACFTEEFGLRHTSTFANNALVCRVGIRCLELLAADDGALVQRVAENGAALKGELDALRERHPELVTDVRGRGFLLGVELTSDHRSFRRQSLLGSLAEQETLAPVLCSYLLEAEGIRIAPTFFGGRVLRVEPALIATEAECEIFVSAVSRTLDALAACDSARLFGPIARRDQQEPVDGVPPRIARPEPLPGDARFAFVVHPLRIESYRDLDEGLREYSDSDLEQLADRLEDARFGAETSAIVIGAGRVESEAEASAFGEFIGIPFTAAELLEMPGTRAVSFVREAVELARDRGAKLVGLGAYTSIVTRNGLALTGTGVDLTTGNGFTAAAAVDAVHAAVGAEGLRGSTVAVVGAPGSIGRAVSTILAEEAGRLILVGNPLHAERSLDRLTSVAEALVARLGRLDGAEREERGGALAASARRALRSQHTVRVTFESLVATGHLKLAVDARESIPEADVVVTCTSTPKPLIEPGWLRSGAVVCDVSQPANVGTAVRDARPDVTVVEGGIVELPGRRDLGVGFGLAPGLVYACMAETILLSLERRYSGGSLGETLDIESISELRALAARHGLRVAHEAKSPVPRAAHAH